MAGVRKKRLPGGKFQGWFTDSIGKRKFFVGTRKRAQTLVMARKIEDDHRQIRLNYRPAPKSYDKAKRRLFSEVSAEYLSWGREQGGIGGRAWSKKHAQKREFYLRFWQDKLGLVTLADLEGILSRVEGVLRNLSTAGKGKSARGTKPAGKTLENYADGLRAFCQWLVKRGLLAEDPLERISSFDTTAKSKRRALTVAEIHTLLNSIDADGTVWAKRRRLGYEVAIASGLRAGEIRALRVGDLDVDRGGLYLRAEWTKNRKPGFQYLPASLVSRLRDASNGKAKEEPLVFVAREAATALEADLRRAGLSKYASDGKVDFHALRVAFTTLVYEAGANLKTAQVLARHSTAQMTLETYGRARDANLANIAEQVGQAVFEYAASERQLREVVEKQYARAISVHAHRPRNANALQSGGLGEKAASFQIPPCPPSFFLPNCRRHTWLAPPQHTALLAVC